MHDHRPTITGRTRVARLDTETLADKARVSLTALKRLESDSGLEVYESTRDQVRRAFEGGGIVLLNSGQSVGVMHWLVTRTT